MVAVQESEAASDRNVANVTVRRGAGRKLLKHPCVDGAHVLGLGCRPCWGRWAGEPLWARSALAVCLSASVEVQGEI